MNDITPIVRLLFAIVFFVFTAFVLPYIKSKLDSNKLANLKAWVQIGVEAAEQIFKGTGLGSEKKAYVLKWLRDHGISIDTAEIEAMIEAAVYRLNAGTATITSEAREMVKSAVQAAEQMFNGDGRGEEKKAMVVEWLNNHGINLDPDILDILIESAVYEINNAIIGIPAEAVVNCVQEVTEQ